MATWVHFGELQPPARCLEGYRWYFVRSQSFDFAFSSLEQLRHCREVLNRNPLPTTRALSALVGPAFGPNQHWLSRLPARLKKASLRGRIVADLIRAEQEFR